MQPNAHLTSHGALAVRSLSEGDPALICLHGFTLHGGMFASLTRYTRCGIVAPDLPGHGETDVRPVDLATTVAVLADWMGGFAGPVPLLGYSQGGRIALHVASQRPKLVSRLLLVSTSPGLPHAERARRTAADEALAARIEALGLDAFLDEWLAHPLVGTAGLAAETAAADRALRMDNAAAGLAAALRGLGQGAMAAVDPGSLDVPVTWIAGERDERYAAVARSQAAAGGGDVWIVPDAGHNVVLTAPARLGSIIDTALIRPAP